jgi:hypothetical protein
MAYENYRFINWATGTPITGERLSQMSTNIEQVKLATDDRPQGLLKYSKLTSLTTYPSEDVAENVLVYLRDDSPASADNRVNADANRYIRLNVTMPGIRVSARGAEDTKYELNIKQGTVSPLTVAKFYLNPHLFGFYDVSSNTSTETVSVRSSGNDVFFGAGSYSAIINTSVSGLTNEEFYVSIQRFANSDITNAPSYSIMASSTSPLEFYAEDIGGTS